MNDEIKMKNGSTIKFTGDTEPKWVGANMNDELPNEVEAYEQDCHNEERAYYELWIAFNEVYGEMMEFHDFCHKMDGCVALLKLNELIQQEK